MAKKSPEFTVAYKIKLAVILLSNKCKGVDVAKANTRK